MPKNHRLKIESRTIIAVIIAAVMAVLFLAGCQTVQPGVITSASMPINDHASDPPICHNRAVFVDHLAAKYAERPRFRGLAANGFLFEVLTAKSGTWTALVTTPAGLTCPIAAGDAWQAIKQQKRDNL